MNFVVRILNIDKNSNLRKFLRKELEIKLFKKLNLDTVEFIRSARQIGFEVSEESLGRFSISSTLTRTDSLTKKKPKFLLRTKCPIFSENY